MRSTKTWSPMSSVSAMELDGISKACRLKVMMIRPITRTTDMEEMNSMTVSFCFAVLFLSSFLANDASRPGLPVHRRRRLAHHAQHPVPAGMKVGHRIRETGQCITARRNDADAGSSVRARPVDEQRTSHDVGARHESPVARVLTVVAVVPQPEV